MKHSKKTTFTVSICLPGHLNHQIPSARNELSGPVSPSETLLHHLAQRGHPRTRFGSSGHSKRLEKSYGVSIHGTPPNGLSVMENHMKVDDLEVPLFQETPIFLQLWSEIPNHKW